MVSDDKVNILLVDDQPAKLLSYETILGRIGGESDQGGIGQGGARATAQAGDRRHPGGRLHAGARRVPAGGDDPRASAFPAHRHHLHIRHPPDRRRPPARLSRWGRSTMFRCRSFRRCCGPRSRSSPSCTAGPAQLEQLNRELERRVAERTAELEASTARLVQSEQRRSLALAAGQMGSWDWDPVSGDFVWDDGQYRIFGVDPQRFAVTSTISAR